MDNFARTFWSGVSSSLSSSIAFAILPISVFIAVLTTTPSPLPYVIGVDIYTIFNLSPIPTFLENVTSLSFKTGTLSPVKLDSLAFKFFASNNLKSAPTVSPSSRITTSPITKSLDLILTLFESLITVDSGEDNFFKASRDVWAFISWTVPIMEFIIMTAKIITTSGQSPTSKNGLDILTPSTIQPAFATVMVS